MRQFLLSIAPDPGAVIFVLLGLAIFAWLYCMITDDRIDDPIVDDFAPRAPIEPEQDARRRQL